MFRDTVLYVFCYDFFKNMIFSTPNVTDKEDVLLPLSSHFSVIPHSSYGVTPKGWSMRRPVTWEEEG